ncbi:MAG: hypothetical protein QNK37_12270 [Acidobacteriota bacterium]|nr:hypothetical protein [Acidobacteriota bacterium]
MDAKSLDHAADAAFATPTACRTNIIVIGLGGYTFTDCLKYGVPLGLLIRIVVSLMIPVIQPPRRPAHRVSVLHSSLREAISSTKHFSIKGVFMQIIMLPGCFLRRFFSVYLGQG